MSAPLRAGEVCLVRHGQTAWSLSGQHTGLTDLPLAFCQEQGVLLIVEPEVLMDGPHGVERCDEVTGRVLQAVFAALHQHGVLAEGMLLEPDMVLSGKECPRQAPVKEVAAATLRCLRRHVPAAVPGVVFLSGGQNDVLATRRLDALRASRRPSVPSSAARAATGWLRWAPMRRRRTSPAGAPRPLRPPDAVGGVPGPGSRRTGPERRRRRCLRWQGSGRASRSAPRIPGTSRS